MELQILKALITDLNLAGVYDNTANEFMNAEKIESQELIKAVFNAKSNEELNSKIEEAFDEGNIANEMTELFATFGSGQRPDLGTIETIQTQKPAVKKTVREQRVIVDPRQQINSVPKEFAPEKTEQKAPPKIINFKPQDYISSKLLDDAKLTLILPYKNENELKSKQDFTLLQNILKAAGTNYQEISIIFIDENYKIATQGVEKEQNKLAELLSEELKSIKQQIILCFGQSCLDLANSEKQTIRQAKDKVLDVANEKKLLANYSISAMLNTPKYKSTTWANILKIKQL